MKLGNGVETKYTYDEQRRWLAKIETAKESAQLQNINYRFDLVGNVKGYKNEAGTYMTKQRYTYDFLYQLVKVEGVSQNYRNGVREYTAGYEQTYSFDTQGLGNMTLKTSMAESSNGKLLGDPLNYQFAYEYESGYAHRAKQIGERYYRYDRNGNVTVEQDGPFETATMSGNADVQQIGDVNYVEQGWGLDPNSGGGGSGGQKYRREYTWDERNRLKESVDMRYQVQYTYDHGGERTGKYAAGTSGSRSETLYFSKMWTWTHSGQWGDSYGRYSKHIFLGESRIATKIVGGDGYHVPGAEQQRQYYYHSDHLGSAQLITNYAGEEYERLEYTPYGELWIEKAAEASVLDIAYRFTGKERDEETGNYYYGARYLDPRTSRWLSTDPAMGDYVPGPGKGAKGLSGMGGVYNTINFHVYGYAANNPIKYVDPDGEINIPIAIKHLQDAEGWKNHTIYKDEKRATIGRAGCAITSIANLSNTVGFHSDPWGINNGAYLDEQGDVEWAKAGSQLGLTLVTAGTGGLSSATYEKNESDKKNNYFTIAKVKIDGGNNPHWVGIRGTMTKTDDEGNSKLYYEISPSSKKDATLDPDRVGQGWIKEDGKIYVPADKITKYKIYSQPTSEQ